MAATNRGWPLPEQTTSPPDVVSWLSQGLNAADTDLGTLILYGPEGSVPGTLDPGQVYMGY